MNCVLFSEDEWGQDLAGNDERSIHVREVLRLGPGDSLRIALIEKGSARALVNRCDADLLQISFPAIAALEPLPKALPIRLILAHPRPPVMQRLLKDINALDINKLSIVLGDLGEKSYFESKIWKDKHYESFLKQGASQGGIARLSQVERHWSLAKALNSLGGQQLEQAHKIVFDLGSNLASFLDFCYQLAHGDYNHIVQGEAEILVAIGCERGWSKAELDIFEAAGFESYSLGKSILRTEAAVNLALGMLSLSLTITVNN